MFKTLKFLFLFSCALAFANASSQESQKTKVLVLGANGSLARVAISQFLETSDVDLRLYLRKSSRLSHLKSPRVEVIEGDVLDENALLRAMDGVDVVYANLDGELEAMAKAIIKNMQKAGLKRLIWVSSLGIYDEIPARDKSRISAYLPPHVASAKIIESSNLNYTIIRPAWFNRDDEVDYELTTKGERFKNPDKTVSRKSIAHLIVRLATEADFGIKESFGINKP